MKVTKNLVNSHAVKVFLNQSLISLFAQGKQVTITCIRLQGGGKGGDPPPGAQKPKHPPANVYLFLPSH